MDGKTTSRRRWSPLRLVFLAALVGAVAVTLVVAVRWGAGAGIERIEDTSAGLAYELPSGWDEVASSDRWDWYSSTADTGGLGASVSAFAQASIDEGALGPASESLAQDHALLLRPELAGFEQLRSEPTEVEGRTAHEVELTATDPVHGPVYVRMLVVATGSGGAGVLFGFADESADQDREGIAEVFASVELL